MPSFRVRHILQDTDSGHQTEVVTVVPATSLGEAVSNVQARCAPGRYHSTVSIEPIPPRNAPNK